MGEALTRSGLAMFRSSTSCEAGREAADVCRTLLDKRGADEMLRPIRSELCRKREASAMVCRFAPWLVHQLNVAMAIRLGIRMTDEQRQRIHDNMQEMIEDILTDYGMRPVAKISGTPLIVVAANADVGPAARPYREALAQAG
jgi:hypothetical protein